MSNEDFLVLIGVTPGGRTTYHRIMNPSACSSPGTQPAYELYPPIYPGEILEEQPIKACEIDDVINKLFEESVFHKTFELLELERAVIRDLSNHLKKVRNKKLYFKVPKLGDPASASQPQSQTPDLGHPCPDIPSIDGCIILNPTDNVLIYDNGTSVEIPIRVSGKFTVQDTLR